MNSINQDLLTYIEDLLHGITRGLPTKVLLYMGNLITIADDTFLYHVDISDKAAPDIMFGYKIISGDRVPLETYEVRELVNKYTWIRSICTVDNHIFENDALRDDPVYEKMIERKVSDGAELYFMNAKGCTPFIPVFGGLPILNNKDTVGINLYKIDDQHHILVDMNVYKKKFKLSYNLYYQILDVNRPIR